MDSACRMGDGIDEDEWDRVQAWIRQVGKHQKWLIQED